MRTHNANQVSDELKNETINETTSSIRDDLPIIGIVSCLFIIQLIGQIPQHYGFYSEEERFAWDGVMVGVSLAVFGLTTLFQRTCCWFYR